MRCSYCFGPLLPAVLRDFRDHCVLGTRQLRRGLEGWGLDFRRSGIGGGVYRSAVNLADIFVVVLEFWSLFLDLFTKINMCSSLVIIFVPFCYIDNCQHHIMTESFLLPG